MSTDTRQSVTRRGVLNGMVLALGTAASQTVAQQKITQGDAGYQLIPKGGQRCGGCFNFQLPNACKFVQGTISINGWCQLYAPST